MNRNLIILHTGSKAKWWQALWRMCRWQIGTNRMLLSACLSTWSLTMTSWRWSSQRTAVPRPGPDSGESLGSGQWSLRCEAGLCCRKTRERKKKCHCHYCHTRSMYWIMTMVWASEDSDATMHFLHWMLTNKISLFIAMLFWQWQNKELKWMTQKKQ